MLNPASKRSPGRRWSLIAGLTIAVLLVLLVGLLVLQPAIVLRAGLRLSGHEEVTFDQLRVGLHELELTGLALGGTSERPASDHLVGRLRLDYRPRDLLRGRLEQVSVEGLRLRGRIDQDGFRLEGLGGAPERADEPAALPALPLPEGISIRDARLELATPVGVVLVPFEAQLRPKQGGATFVLDAERSELAAPTGQLRLDLHVEGEVPLEAPSPERSFADGITASGRAELNAEALSFPGVARAIGGRGELRFVWERGRLSASLSKMAARIGALEPEWDAVAELLPAPWQVESAQPIGISASFVDQEMRLEASGRLALATAGPRLDGALSASLDLDAEGRIREIVVPAAEIDLRELHVAEMQIERGSIRLEGAGAPEAWEGSLALELAGASGSLTDLSVDGAAARAGLDVRFADGRLTASVRAPGTLRIAALSWGEDVRVDGLEARVEPSSTPLLSAELAGSGVAWQQHLEASVPEFEVAAGAGDAPLRLTAGVEQLQLVLAGDRAGFATGRVALSGGVLSAPAYQMRASGIAAEVALSAGGLSTEAPVPVSVASIVHAGKPPWFAPLRLNGSVRPQDEVISFDLELGSTASEAALRVRGEHDLASAGGRAEVDLPPVEFAPGRLQPAALAPPSADAIEDVSGRVALDGALRWGAGEEVRADLHLLVENLAFTSGPARIAQVNGVIAFDRLAPLSTPPGQQLAIGLIDLGLPLTDGLLTFDLQPGQLQVEQLRWRFAEGRIRAAPFTIGSGGIRFSTTLTAERLKLDEIFALAQLDGLSGEGTMHGTLPITVAGAEAVIHDGELVSDRPGWVRYRPDQAPAALQAGGENVNLLLQALQNFRYQELRLGIDGRTDGDMDVRLHIAGANPDLYDGYPIEFNLNLEGALADVLRAGLAGYQIPERIRERMQGFGR